MKRTQRPNFFSAGRRRWRLLVSLGVVVLALGLSTAHLYRVIHTPGFHTQADQIITVAHGMTVHQIYRQLQDRGILPDSPVLRLWFKFKASTNTLKAGDYLFESPISPAKVIAKLTQGDIYYQWVTFPEGLSRFEVAKLIQSINIIGADKALNLTESPELIRLISDLDPQATTVEGYLFPDTYQYTSTTTASQLLATMIKRFRQVFTPTYLQRANELHMSVREVVTLASMIELEARLPEERPMISSVYHNRLRLGMKLDCDPTVIYASLLAGTWSGTIRRSDLERKSPYNTYLNPGLPPGPIASPGRASIEAALYPANTQHLYFVVDATRQDGAHLFSDKLNRHQANVALYHLAQRRRDKLNRPGGPH